MHPPTKGQLQAIHHVGQIKERVNFARRLENHRTDPTLIRQALRRTYGAHLRALGMPDAKISRLAPVPPPAMRGMPTTGVRKIFALLIEFQDDRHRNDQRAIHQALFGRNGPGAPCDSMAAYYDRSSYNQLDLYGGTTLAWYMTPYPRTAVDQSDAGRERLIKEALEHFNSVGHNFSQYDTNHDGVVDFFMVLWAGKDTGWSTFWWAYQTSFGDDSFSLDGVRFANHAWMWESIPVGSPFDPTIVIHEIGHALGLPDYYDYDASKGPRGGLGGLDMMDSAKYDHNCFSKWLLDWVTPKIVTQGSKLVTLQPSEQSPDCVLISPHVNPDAQFDEFFMIENRQKRGNDLELPGQGLVLWHVDARLRGDNFAFDNSFTDHKLLRLMEADGLEEIEAGGLADSEDFYNAGKGFGCETIPSSANYRGLSSGVTVKDISEDGDQLSAMFAIAPS
jgi:M6 family metalloprotease-like protein